MDANLLSTVMGGSYNEVANLILPCNTSDSCPPIMALGNQSLNCNEVYQMSQLTSSNGLVTNGADVELRSENQVILNSGFEVEQGGKLNVSIKVCE